MYPSKVGFFCVERLLEKGTNHETAKEERLSFG